MVFIIKIINQLMFKKLSKIILNAEKLANNGISQLKIEP